MNTELLLAQSICRVLYEHFSKYQVFPALTGGTLYKDGTRKDIDIVLFQPTIAGELDSSTKLSVQPPTLIEMKTDLVTELKALGFKDIMDYTAIIKCVYKGQSIDLILPQAGEGTYPEDLV